MRVGFKVTSWPPWLGRGKDATCAARGTACRLPFRSGPSLHQLRRRRGAFVRSLLRLLCPDPISPNRASLVSDTSIPLWPRTTRGDSETPQVPTEDVHACLGSSTPRGRTGPHPVGPARDGFDLIDGLGTPELKYFGAQ